MLYQIAVAQTSFSKQKKISFVDCSLENSQKYVLRVDDKPFYMINIQIRLDKLRYHWNWDATSREMIVAQAAADGFNTLSIPIHWYEVEIKKDEFNWSILDEYMSLCKKYGLKMEMLWFSQNSGGHVQWLGIEKKPVHLRTPDYILYSPNPKSQETKSDYTLKKPYTPDMANDKLKEREAYVLGRVMEHISEWDEANFNPHTVIGVQLGNEVEGFESYLVISYLNALAKAVKKSSYSVWTRVNCTYWSRNGRIEENEKLRASAEGTHIDFVGYDTYRHHFKTDEDYKESMRTYFSYKGKNYRMVMEIGAEIPIIAKMHLAALSGNIAFDYYDMIGPDGHGLYERNGATYKERSNIGETRIVNKLIKSDISDLALNANGYGLYVHNWKSNSIAPTTGVEGIVFTPDTISSQGISIRRSNTEIVLMNTQGGTFTYPESLGVTAADKGYFDSNNEWINEGNVSYTSTSITPPVGTTIRLIRRDAGEKQPVLILQAEFAELDNGTVFESGNGLIGFAGIGYAKLPVNKGASIKWFDVDGLSGGNRMIKIRYAYAGSKPAKVRLYTNDKGQNIYLQPTGSEEIYNYYTMSVPLSNGANNTIRMESIDLEREGNVDELQVF